MLLPPAPLLVRCAVLHAARGRNPLPPQKTIAAGVFAIYAAQAVGSLGRVLALEPAPRTLAACEANIESHAAWCKERTSVAPAPVDAILAPCGAGSPNELKVMCGAAHRSSGVSRLQHPPCIDAVTPDSMQRRVQALHTVTCRPDCMCRATLWRAWRAATWRATA